MRFRRVEMVLMVLASLAGLSEQKIYTLIPSKIEKIELKNLPQKVDPKLLPDIFSNAEPRYTPKNTPNSSKQPKIDQKDQNSKIPKIVNFIEGKVETRYKAFSSALQIILTLKPASTDPKAYKKTKFFVTKFSVKYSHPEYNNTILRYSPAWLRTRERNKDAYFKGPSNFHYFSLDQNFDLLPVSRTPLTAPLVLANINIMNKVGVFGKSRYTYEMHINFLDIFFEENGALHKLSVSNQANLVPIGSIFSLFDQLLLIFCLIFTTCLEIFKVVFSGFPYQKTHSEQWLGHKASHFLALIGYFRLCSIFGFTMFFFGALRIGELKKASEYLADLRVRLGVRNERFWSIFFTKKVNFLIFPIIAIWAIFMLIKPFYIVHGTLLYLLLTVLDFVGLEDLDVVKYSPWTVFWIFAVYTASNQLLYACFLYRYSWELLSRPPFSIWWVSVYLFTYFLFFCFSWLKFKSRRFRVKDGGEMDVLDPADGFEGVKVVCNSALGSENEKIGFFEKRLNFAFLAKRFSGVRGLAVRIAGKDFYEPVYTPLRSSPIYNLSYSVKRYNKFDGLLAAFSPGLTLKGLPNTPETPQKHPKSPQTTFSAEFQKFKKWLFFATRKRESRVITIFGVWDQHTNQKNQDLVVFVEYLNRTLKVVHLKTRRLVFKHKSDRFPFVRDLNSADFQLMFLVDGSYRMVITDVDEIQIIRGRYRRVESGEKVAENGEKWRISKNEFLGENGQNGGGIGFDADQGGYESEEEAFRRKIELEMGLFRRKTKIKKNEKSGKNDPNQPKTLDVVYNFEFTDVRIDPDYFNYPQIWYLTSKITKSILYENLIATYYVLVDKANYKRKYWNEAKIHNIYVSELKREKRLNFDPEADEEYIEVKEVCRNVVSLQRIMESALSTHKISHFEFLNKSTICVFSRDLVGIIDWRAASLTRVIRIRALSLSSHFRNVDFSKNPNFDFCSIFHYNRRRGRLHFCLFGRELPNEQQWERFVAYNPRIESELVGKFVKGFVEFSESTVNRMTRNSAGGVWDSDVHNRNADLLDYSGAESERNRLNTGCFRDDFEVDFEESGMREIGAVTRNDTNLKNRATAKEM